MAETAEIAAALFRSIATLSPRPDPLWGIDQEFVFAPGLLLERLARRAPGEMRPALQALVAREDAAYRTIAAEKNPAAGTMFMNQPLPESWAAIRQAFAAARDGEALATLDALEGQGTASGWAFYDLRPLRARFGGGTQDNPGLEPLLRGFDAVIVLDRVRAARLTPSLEGGPGEGKP